ncbi:family 43 glycosylhydrolase [Microbacterium sp. NPDC089189]|uniref:glycoside hydrolase family 43 protein n=1 Tax=Microbacterium sp. NPDC089189 TaxID=3154972 RepID=UPI0034340905
MTGILPPAPLAESDRRSPATRPSSIEPIIAGFHPDPSICRVGGDYYLVNSSFEYWPGVPVWHSTDLVRWEQIGNALSVDEAAAGTSVASGGIYAPTIRHHDGRFWIITTDVGNGGGQIVVSAVDPRGPWSAPLRLEGLVGIDPDLAWDGDDCLVTFCATSGPVTGIAQARVDLGTGRVLETPRALWAGAGLAYPEAPHLYEREGWWYLVLAEGGTERGHGVTVARSASPRGPFEGHPRNPILSHRSTTHPVQNTGHADLVQREDGEWAAVYLGVRPRGMTPMFHVNGRETFLAGVRWEDGWPVFDEERYDIPVRDRSFEETFAGALHPRWVSPGAPVLQQLTRSDDGARVHAVDGAGQTPSAIVARVTDHRWTFTAEIDDVTGTAVVLVRLDDAHSAEVRVADGRASTALRIGPIAQDLTAPVPVSDGPVLVGIRSVASETSGPDDLEFWAESGGVRHALGRTDGRYLSTEVAGGFTGRVVGIRAIDGSFRVGCVTYTGFDAHDAEACAPR